MILDSLDHSDRYLDCHPLFKRAFSFLKSLDDVSGLTGRINLDGDRLFAIVARGQGRGPAASPLETHRQYIDIQYAVRGTDRIGWKPIPAGTPGRGYDAEKDIEFFDGKPDQWIRHAPGRFCVFFPEDGHAPMASETRIVKVVVKVRVSPGRSSGRKSKRPGRQ